MVNIYSLKIVNLGTGRILTDPFIHSAPHRQLDGSHWAMNIVFTNRYLIFISGMSGTVSISSSDFTMSWVPVLYF
ncbi:hypothetical protein Slin_1277 [Spirosoma linguale DSM 74]|uniref:Uncharacterized protein n=1 Tax=Spirosoma linguale (strain ATCC 33905 / DSM 74 / LMG 10896 / Claus 1) TaxID=504472 RepID=D2QLX1_SPILD|nr:hypothetical protein Slin_1277 [Spirosoma linguale DSM 74]